MNLPRIISSSLYVFFLFLLPINSVLARIQVYPLKVFLDQRNKGAEVTARNLSSQAGNYRISTILFNQKENGQMAIQSSDEEYDKDLSNYVRFSPRVVQLGPGESQTVRLFIRNVAELPEGDYRTHLRFEQTLESFQSNRDNDDLVTDGQIKTGLDTRIAVSIPLFYRKGSPEYGLSLENLEVNIDKEKIENSTFSVTLNKAGEAFAYGSIYLYLLNQDGEKQQIGFVNGAQSFISKRKFSYPISEINQYRDKILSQSKKTYLLEFKSTRDGEEDVVVSTQAEI